MPLVLARAAARPILTPLGTAGNALLVDGATIIGPAAQAQEQRSIINGGDEIIIDFQGQPIRLPHERWLHITDPASRHPYMLNMRPELHLTLQDPDLVKKSLHHPETVRIYFKWFERTVVGSKWVAVVVRFFADGDAFVLTAYGENNLMPGEELWRKAQ